MEPRQQQLFAYLNPLQERFGIEFFRKIPRRPGVYFFKSASGEILYIGKAKSLRNRLGSYKNARPNIVSRKVLRMLRLTRTIEWLECENETQALLTENKLLREICPPFNVVNTRPDTYYFLVLKKLGDGMIRIEITNDESTGRQVGRVFGVFRGRGRTREAYRGLLRLLAVLEAKDDTFYFPNALVRYRPPREYELRLPEELMSPLCAFLGGRSRAFLDKLMALLLANEGIPRFIHHVIGEDMKTLEDFYVYGPQRVRRLKRLSGIQRRPIAQNEIDDLLALFGSERRVPAGT